MTRHLSMLAVLTLTMACNNVSKDQVEKADSANRVNRQNDTVSDKKVAITTGKAGTEFLVRAMDAGLMELTLGNIARQKAVNKRVRDCGDMIVRDHAEAGDKIKSLAAARTVALPSMTGDDNAKIIGRINSRKNGQFDKAYIDQMVDDHQKNIKDFETASDNVDDSEIRSFIGATLPVLRKHLDSCKAIQRWLDEKH